MTEDLLTVIGWILVVGALIFGVVVVAMLARRIIIERPGGTVDCGLRRTGDRRWRSGIAAYQPAELCWYSSVGFRLRPNEVFDRRSLNAVARRNEVGLGTVVVQFDTGADLDPVWLAMSQDALTGFLAWLEAAPHRVPGSG